jgi:hypothetical protein
MLFPRAASLVLVSAGLVTLLVVITCAGEGGKTYSSVAEALREAKGSRHGRVSDSAAFYLLEKLELDWEYTARPHLNSWNDFAVQPSSGGEYYLLSAAVADEWGQHGPVAYCMVDAAGTVHWRREGRINAPPCVSSRGTAVLIYAEGESWVGANPGPVRLDFIGLKGDLLGTVKLDGRVSRPLQRYYLYEKIGFSPDGGLLVTTMNLASETNTGRSSGYNNTTLLAFKIDGTEAWRHELGGFWPKQLEFDEGGARIRLTGEWRARLILDQAFDIGFMVFSLEGELLEKTVTRHVPGIELPE